MIIDRWPLIISRFSCEPDRIGNSHHLFCRPDVMTPNEVSSIQDPNGNG
jgi:hypothetical protein